MAINPVGGHLRCRVADRVVKKLFERAASVASATEAAQLQALALIIESANAEIADELLQERQRRFIT